MNTAFDANTAALHQEMSRQETAEEEQARLEREFPFEDFEEQAIENLNNETGFEFLQSMLELHPDQMRRALLRTINLTCYLPFPDRCSTMTRLQDELALMQFAVGWVEEEQERLQGEAIEAAR